MLVRASKTRSGAAQAGPRLAHHRPDRSSTLGLASRKGVRRVLIDRKIGVVPPI